MKAAGQRICAERAPIAPTLLLKPEELAHDRLEVRRIGGAEKRAPNRLGLRPRPAQILPLLARKYGAPLLVDGHERHNRAEFFATRFEDAGRALRRQEHCARTQARNIKFLPARNPESR